MNLTKSKDAKIKGGMASALIGAAFIMATSAIGPGTLTQTALFTEEYGASFAFVIFISAILAILAQINIWRVITVSGFRGQDVANKVFPKLGYVLTFFVCLGGLAFNIGNISGAGLGLNVLLGIDVKIGVVISAFCAFALFSFKEFGDKMDRFAKYLGIAMILLTLYIAFTTNPPVGEAITRMFIPAKIAMFTIITTVGGGVGGYVSFAGAHRLLDAGITGKENLEKVTKSSINGNIIVAVMRMVLFLAVLGVVQRGIPLDQGNPAASAFQIGSGDIGYRFFGLVLWAAGITSVVGASYTSVSFLRTLSDSIERNARKWIIGFISASTIIFLTIGRPVQLLVLAGALNGLILPITLGTMLVASRRSDIVGDYRHPTWMIIAGVIVAAITLYAGIGSLSSLAGLFK